jgi:hypothetical protein
MFGKCGTRGFEAAAAHDLRQQGHPTILPSVAGGYPASATTHQPKKIRKKSDNKRKREKLGG